MKNLPYIDYRYIDPLMVPIIQSLNDKGYFTLFCCESHSDDSDVYIKEYDEDLEDDAIRLLTWMEKEDGRIEYDVITGYKNAEMSFLENNAYIYFGFGYEGLLEEFSKTYLNFDSEKAIEYMIRAVRFSNVLYLEGDYRHCAIRVKTFDIYKNIEYLRLHEKEAIEYARKRKVEVISALREFADKLPDIYDA